MLLVALVLACAATASVSAQKLCTCPDTTVCEGAPSSCGSPPGLSLAFAIGPIQRLYGYSTKKSGVADAAACRAFCGANSYYEYVSVGKRPPFPRPHTPPCPLPFPSVLPSHSILRKDGRTRSISSHILFGSHWDCLKSKCDTLEKVRVKWEVSYLFLPGLAPPGLLTPDCTLLFRRRCNIGNHWPCPD